jgi:hypothetical protein
MAKRRVGSQTTNLTPDQKKSKIDPIYLSADGMQHTVGKLSIRATTLLYITSRSEVYSQNYVAPKLRESQLRRMGVSRQKVIWMWAPWRGAEYTIRGKVVAYPPSPGHGESCVFVLPVARPSTKSVPTMH